MHSFDEFRNYWLKNSAPVRKCFNMVFVVVYPDELPWDKTTEKLTHNTALLMSGGFTGAGTGVNLQLLYKSELNDALKQMMIAEDLDDLRNLAQTAQVPMSKSYYLNRTADKTNYLLERVKDEFNDAEQYKVTHAMIVSIGWIMDTLAEKTSIREFMEWAERNNEYCRGHIIAHPNKTAKLHHQHIEVNLKEWKELNFPKLYANCDEYKRSSDNFHDDYTPSWFKPEELPIIRNFAQHERNKKAFGYPESKKHKDKHDKFWKEKDFTFRKDDKYFHFFTNRLTMSDEYYIDNNEDLNNSEVKGFVDKCDVLISPTAGYYTEILAKIHNYPKKVIMYDHSQKVCDLKEMILDTNMSREEQIELKKIGYEVNYNHNGTHQKAVYSHFTKDLDLCEEQEKVLDKSDVKVEVMDLMTYDYNKLIPIIKDKIVYFNASNIFGYHIVHAYYSIEEIRQKYKELRLILKKHCKQHHYRGTNPVKRRIIKLRDQGLPF